MTEPSVYRAPPPSAKAFSTDIRVLPCSNCGAPMRTRTVVSRIPLPVDVIVGRRFSGFWSRERPDRFVDMVFGITPQEAEASKRR
jgi:hypothetical protein